MRDEGFGFETMFMAMAEDGKPLDVDGIRDYFESIGESVLVAGDARAIKVHIHNERPDQVLAYALGLGTLSKITIENLDQQTEDVRETRAAAFAGDASPSDPSPSDARDAPTGIANAVIDSPTNGAFPSADAPALAVVAVAAGEGLAAIFRDFGVHKVVYGGQTANPSTGELLEAVKAVDAREILLLPNNPNVVLAARQVTSMSDRPVAVVATRNAAEGFAALLAMDPDKSAADNAAAMTAAGRGIQSLSVTEAVRDATVSGRKVKHGQTIALDPDDGLVAVHDDPSTAVLEAVKALTPGFELITVYYGESGDLAGTEALARRIHDLGTGAEVEVLHGGQPHYRYLISAE
jgi:dihydroxyacetone kinase-like predicted kinase